MLCKSNRLNISACNHSYVGKGKDSPFTATVIQKEYKWIKAGNRIPTNKLSVDVDIHIGCI